MKPNPNWKTEGAFQKALKKSRTLRKFPTKAERKLFDALVTEGIEFIFKGVFSISGFFYFTDFIFPLREGNRLMVEIIPRGRNKKNEKYPMGYVVKVFTDNFVLRNTETVVSEICECEVMPSLDLITETMRMEGKLIPDGLKGDGSFEEEPYGYVIGRTSHKYKKYRNSKTFKRIH